MGGPWRLRPKPRRPTRPGAQATRAAPSRRHPGSILSPVPRCALVNDWTRAEQRSAKSTACVCVSECVCGGGGVEGINITAEKEARRRCRAQVHEDRESTDGGALVGAPDVEPSIEPPLLEPIMLRIGCDEGAPVQQLVHRRLHLQYQGPPTAHRALESAWVPVAKRKIPIPNTLPVL